MAQAPLRHLRPAGEPSADVCWHEGNVRRDARWEQLGQRGATIWFTGLSGSGKSTVAAAVEEELVNRGRPAFMLDGDNLRHGINGDLGFSDRDRTENVRRAGEVAKLFAESGAVALISLISPCAADRDLIRTLHEEAGLPFVEVYLDTPLAECERRDVKGLYARARAGQLPGFTGIDAAYEVPERADLVLRPTSGTVSEQAGLVISLVTGLLS